MSLPSWASRAIAVFSQCVCIQCESFHCSTILRREKKEGFSSPIFMYLAYKDWVRAGHFRLFYSLWVLSRHISSSLFFLFIWGRNELLARCTHLPPSAIKGAYTVKVHIWSEECYAKKMHVTFGYIIIPTIIKWKIWVKPRSISDIEIIEKLYTS